MDLIITIGSCLWSLRIFPSLPGSRFFYRDASSALLQLYKLFITIDNHWSNTWLNLVPISYKLILGS